MTIKVKHILLVLVIIIIAIIVYIFLRNSINELIIKRKYANQVVNFMNFDSFDNIVDASVERYSYIFNYYNEPDIDISPLIESYIKQVEANEKSGGILNGKYRVKLTSNMKREIEGADYTDTTNVFYGTNRNLDIKELEKILVHKSESKYSDWCIPKDSPQIIDLPYNYYLEYEPSDFKLLDDVKKVTKCIFPNKLEMRFDNGRNEVIIEYINKDNTKIRKNGAVYISKEDDYKITVFLNNLYYSQTHNAKIVLKNHYNDLIIKEIEKRGYYNDPGWVWKWDKEDCKEIVDKIKKDGSKN